MGDHLFKIAYSEMFKLLIPRQFFALRQILRSWSFFHVYIEYKNSISGKRVAQYWERNAYKVGCWAHKRYFYHIVQLEAMHSYPEAYYSLLGCSVVSKGNDY